MESWTLCAVLLYLLADFTSASPGIAFPINSQVPPVARIARQFQFTFSTSTFSSASPSIQYVLVGSPQWLHLDDASRTFSGTPSTGDMGSANFNLVATDDTGTTSMPVTFIVSSQQGPGLGLSVTEQLPSFGTFSSPDSLVLHPSSPLAISFRPDTFTSTDDSTLYYAICANNTPLPSWIQFDPRGLSFTGSTPSFSSEYELPQEFGIHLIASDVAGFSAVAAFFSIVVESHELTFANNTLYIQVSAGMTVNFSGIQSSLRLDGQSIKAADIKSVTASTPPWLSLDDTALTITGTAPRGVISQSFLVTVEDVYGDNANTTIFISVGNTTRLMYAAIPPLYATLGTQFSFQCNRALFAQDSTIHLDLGNTSSWLKFDETSLRLSGLVPIDLEPQTYGLNLTVSQGIVSDFQIVTLSIGRESGTTTTSRTTLFQPTPSSTRVNGHGPTTQVSPDTTSDAESNRQRIAAAVVLPIVIILALLLVVLWFRRNRRRRHRQKGGQTSRAQIGEPEPQRLSKAPRIDFTPVLGVIDRPGIQSKPQSPALRPLTAGPSKRGSAQSFMRPWSRMFNDSTDKHNHHNTPEYSIAEDRRDRPPSEAASRRPLSHRRIPSKPAPPTAHTSCQYTRRSLKTASAFGSSLRLNGFGHGCPIVGPSLPTREVSRMNRRDSNMSSLLVMDNGRGCRDHRKSSLYGHGIIRTSQKPSVTREESVGWYTVSDDTTISTKPERPSPSKSRPTSQATIIHEDEDDQPTVRAVGSPKEIKLSPRKSREKYYKERRRLPQTYSALFSGNTSLRKTSSTLTQNLNIIKNSSSWTDDDPYTFNDKENPSSTFTRSTTASAQRKGKMIQQQQQQRSLSSFSASPHDTRYRARGNTPSQQLLGYGIPPRLSHFRSRSSMASSSRRFENAESEISSDVEDDYEGQFILERRAQHLGGGEVTNGGKRTWAPHAGHENPLDAHGGESSSADAAAAAGSSRLPRSPRGRWSFLESGGRRGAMAPTTTTLVQQGEEWERGDGKLVLGERGKRPVSVENRLDRGRGAPGSTSFRAERAFI